MTDPDRAHRRLPKDGAGPGTDSPRVSRWHRRRVRRWIGRLAMLAPCLSLLAGIADARPAAQDPAHGSRAVPSAPAEFRTLIGKSVWYAPHSGCLDRLWLGSPPGRLARVFPEQSLRLRIDGVMRERGQWAFRFDSDAGEGITPGLRVIEDVRFEALPSTFYQTCFFLEPPDHVAGYLQARAPLAFQRYAGPDATQRRSEIERIEAADRRSR